MTISIESSKQTVRSLQCNPRRWRSYYGSWVCATHRLRKRRMSCWLGLGDVPNQALRVSMRRNGYGFLLDRKFGWLATRNT